jgi:O-methyltransferase involved in polyketide biosynthesis
VVEHVPRRRAEGDVTGEKQGDLGVTALYTSAAWRWGGLPNAELLEHPRARGVFRAVNGTLALTRPFLGGGAAPLRVALLHRHALIDALLRASGARTVIELAAGLSRRGVSFSEDPALTYVEVDRPNMMATKRELLARTHAGRAVLARKNLVLVDGDVLETSFDELAPAGAPLFVIAEGLLMYLDAAQQRALAGAIARRLARGGGTFVFDFVPPCEQPASGAVGRGLEWLMKRFTKGQAFAKDTRTRDDVLADLRAAGFDRVEAIEPRTVAHDLGLPYPDAPTQQLVFVAHATDHAREGRS